MLQALTARAVMARAAANVAAEARDRDEEPSKAEVASARQRQLSASAERHSGDGFLHDVDAVLQEEEELEEEAAAAAAAAAPQPSPRISVHMAARVSMVASKGRSVVTQLRAEVAALQARGLPRLRLPRPVPLPCSPARFARACRRLAERPC